PRYRDIALCWLGAACLAVPDRAWTAERLRRILEVGLDQEGGVFTCDVPTQLLAEAGRAGLDHPPLRRHLDEAAVTARPRGVRTRAVSARAATQFHAGRAPEALAALEEAEGIRRGFAGFSTLHILALASRWLEFGQPARARAAANRAEEVATQVQNPQ